MRLLFLSALFACQSTEKDTEPNEENIVVDQDGDGYTAEEDCDDSSEFIHPGMEETCDGIDNNCNGTADEGVQTTFYADSDDDGFGNAEIMTEACEVPDGYVSNGSDCDDTSADSYPGGEEFCDGLDNDCNGEIDENLDIEFYMDEDGDGFGDADSIVQGCSPEIGLSTIDGDCDDSDASISPIANEICDEIDNNCNDEIDEGATTTFYADSDEDGYGDPDNTAEACELMVGYVTNADDCADNDTQIHPGADEYCDTVDNDCDGDIDELGAVDGDVWYQDSDQDGYGNPDATTTACSEPTGYVSNYGDCDDLNNIFNPSATESCDGFDNNCDGQIDEDGALNADTYYADSDGDGYGNPDQTVLSCSNPSGYVSNSDDCNDNNEDVFSGAVEVCNGLDDDCNDAIDDQPSDPIAYFVDSDGDGFGDDDNQESACTLPSNASLQGGDCDDDNTAVYPSATEICDGFDNDCNGIADGEDAVDAETFYFDYDGDGHGDAAVTVLDCSSPSGYAVSGDDCDDSDDSISPSADEYCDGSDNNCDGYTDEDSAIDVSTWSIDYDGDGYGSSTFTLIQCDQPNGYIMDDSDCDDTDMAVNSDATEICDGIDNNCNGDVDDDDVAIDTTTHRTYYYDGDADEYGDDDVFVMACDAPDSTYVSAGGDCDDSNDLYHPNANLACDGSDYDCDGNVDNDADGDGYADQSCGGTDCDDDDPDVYQCVYNSCAELLAEQPTSISGVYSIETDTSGEVDVYCDMSTDSGGWTLVWKMHHQSSHSNNGPLDTSLTACDIDPTTSVNVGEECNIPYKWTNFEPSEIRLVNQFFTQTPALSYDWKYTSPSSALDSSNNILPYTSSSHFVSLTDNCGSSSSLPPTTDSVSSPKWTDKASPGGPGNWDVDLTNALFDANCNRVYDGSGGYDTATTYLFVR
ncbi:MAG: MopE-related protein [Myxococcota bacterium]|nr:MopE-related protein [Myxococcota bacterium]